MVRVPLYQANRLTRKSSLQFSGNGFSGSESIKIAYHLVMMTIYGILAESRKDRLKEHSLRIPFGNTELA